MNGERIRKELRNLILVMDGAMGTMIQDKGEHPPLSSIPILWMPA